MSEDCPENNAGLRPEYWRHVPLDEMNRAEWEALCDGCAKCCLIKLEFEDNDELAYTNIACRLLDHDTCRCRNYALRQQLVPTCVRLDPVSLERSAHWMPQTCAYRLIHEGKDLPDWHPLRSGDPEGAHKAGISLRGKMVAEEAIEEDDWQDYVIEEVL